MKKFSEAVLAPNVHMAKKASPFHPHSKGLVYTPKGKEEIRPIDTADAGYGGATVADAEGGDANPGIASKKAVSPMPMSTLVKPGLDQAKKKPGVKEGFDPSSEDIAKELVAKHGKKVTKDHIRDLEQDRDTHRGLDHDEIMAHVKKLQEETEKERLQRLRSFAWRNKSKGLGDDYHGVPTLEEAESVNEVLDTPERQASYIAKAKKSTDELSAAGKHRKATNRIISTIRAQTKQIGQQIQGMKKSMAEEVEQIDEAKLDKMSLKDLWRAHTHSTYQSDQGTSAGRYSIHHNDKAANVIKKHVAKKYGNEVANDMEAHSNHELMAGEYNSGKEAEAGFKAAAKLRKKHNLSFHEESDQIDELKKSTLASYAKKATDDVSYHSFTAGTMSSKDPERLVHDKKAMKRQAGVEKAIDKITKEEVEQIDELKKSTLASYITKAAKDAGEKTLDVDYYERSDSQSQRSRSSPEVIRATKAVKKRYANIDKAAKKLAGIPIPKPKPKKPKVAKPVYNTGDPNATPSWLKKEEVEQIDEKKGQTLLVVPKKPDSKGEKPVKRIHANEWPRYKSTHFQAMEEDNNGTEADEGEYGYEGDMAMSQLKSIIRNAKDLHDNMEPKTDLPEWLQAKITLATDYIQTAADYWRSEKEESVSEERKSKVPRIGPMEKALEEEVWDKPMPDSKKQGSLTPEQKAKAKARAERAGRSYPNMIDNMWASKQ